MTRLATEEIAAPATGTRNGPLKVALLTNLVAPYRVPIYNLLGERFALHLLCSGPEDNRREWIGLEGALRGIEAKRSAGMSFKYFAPRSGLAYDDRYLHINPGYLLDLAKIRPEAVISVELGFRSLCAALYSAVARVPLWIWWEGSIETERDIGIVRKVLRRAIARRAHRWISGGLNATRYLRTLGVENARIVHAQNCVDESQFIDAKAPAKSLGRRPVLLVVGRLVPSKGVDLLLDVVARLKAEGRECSVILVGDGSERERLKQKVQELGLENVEFHLTRPAAEMPAYYRGADLLVLPTLHDVWGLVVSEALWSGLPVLASKYAGCAAEVLPADQIFDPADPEDFIGKLRHALDAGLPPVDTSPLMGVRQVADAIGEDIEQHLGDPGARLGQRRRIKKAVQAAVRSAHLRGFDRGVPPGVAIYLHSFDAACYPRFEEMVRYFRDLGHGVTGPEGFLAAPASTRRLFISCDDNFRAWHDALPLFARLGVTLTFYVNSLPLVRDVSSAELSNFYRRIAQPPHTPPLTRAQLRELAAQGHTIGSHTHSHRVLSALPLAVAQEEIRRGRAELEDILGTRVPHFSYPFGMARHFSEALREYCRRAGFETVANAVPGRLHGPQESFSLNRTGWDLRRPLGWNLDNLRVDGTWFERLTGRSAVGSVFPDS